MFDNSNWSLAASDANAYKGSSVAGLVAKVFVVERNTDGVALQVYADPKNSDLATIVAYNDPAFVVNEDDYVKITGTVRGELTGTNAFGGDVVDPVIDADIVKVVSALAARSPANETFGGGTDASYAPILFKVRKVEFASDETRVFVTVRNGSSYSVSVYASSAKAVSGSRVYESTFSDYDYPDLASDIPPGSTSSGIVVFPPMNSAKAFRILAEGYSEDDTIGDYGSLKWELDWSA